MEVNLRAVCLVRAMIDDFDADVDDFDVLSDG